MLAGQLRRVGDRVPVTAVLLVLAGQLLLPAGWSGTAGWVLLTVGLLVGLPHGAVDHLVPLWVSSRTLPRVVLAALAVGYATVAGLAFLLLRAAPTAGVLAFLAISVVHFGTGEVGYARLRDAPGLVPVAGWLSGAGTVFAWGATVVLLPLLRWPAKTGPVLDELAPGSGGLLTPAGRAVAVVFVLLAAAATATALRSGAYRPANELALLVLLMLLVPPLPAFAAYFGGWHALRHVVRLLGTDPGNSEALAAGRLARPVSRFAVQSLPPTVLALAALGLLWARAGTAGAFVSADLSLLAALTVPHTLIVCWLDRQASTAPSAGHPRQVPT